MKRHISLFLGLFFTLSLGSPRPADRMEEVVGKTNQFTPDPVEVVPDSDKSRYDEARVIFEQERLKRREEREFNKNTQPSQPYPLLP